MLVINMINCFFSVLYNSFTRQGIHVFFFLELGERLTNAYPQEYKERIQKERKVCSDRFYPLPKCTYPSLHRGRLTDISGVTRGQVILMAILFTACFCISPLKSLAHSLFNVLIYCLDMLIYFFDSAAAVMAVHDILQLF